MNEDFSRVVRLARIELTSEEERRISPQLNEVLRYMDKLKELSVEGIKPTAHAVPLENVMRADESGVSLSQGEALSNAPQTANGLFVVPKIVE